MNWLASNYFQWCSKYEIEEKDGPKNEERDDIVKLIVPHGITLARQVKK